MGSVAQQSLTTQLEHLHSRYVGTGHPDTSRREWAENQHRDSIASYLGHDSIVEYFALAEGVSVGRARFNLLERLHQPVGKRSQPSEELSSTGKEAVDTDKSGVEER